MTALLSNRDIYTSVICGIVPQVRERLWIATADIKDMYVDSGGREMVPFLEVLDGMVKLGIEVRQTSLSCGLEMLNTIVSPGCLTEFANIV